jgi:hypothetical protein
MSIILPRLTRHPHGAIFFLNDVVFVVLVALLVGFVIALLAW